LTSRQILKPTSPSRRCARRKAAAPAPARSDGTGGHGAKVFCCSVDADRPPFSRRALRFFVLTQLRHDQPEMISSRGSWDIQCASVRFWPYAIRIWVKPARVSPIQFDRPGHRECGSTAEYGESRRAGRRRACPTWPGVQLYGGCQGAFGHAEQFGNIVILECRMAERFGSAGMWQGIELGSPGLHDQCSIEWSAERNHCALISCPERMRSPRPTA